MVLLFASLACSTVTGGGENSNDTGFSFTTANITNAHMAIDESDSQQTNTYAPSTQSFYCYFDLNNAPDDTVVKGEWILVSAEGFESNSVIDTADITGGDNTYYFTLDRSSDAWPVGKYKVNLFVNDKLVQTVEFQVK
jgi:hypothetical protein